jgi:hypothetical protein
LGEKNLLFSPSIYIFGILDVLFFLMGWMDAGDNQPVDNIPIPCMDAVEFCFMPNLTGCCTLNKLVSISASCIFQL